jgi:hypothetical protein
MSKSAPLSLRIDPACKEALQKVSEREHRSIANVVEYLILSYCKEHGIQVQPQKFANARGGKNG